MSASRKLANLAQGIKSVLQRDVRDLFSEFLGMVQRAVLPMTRICVPLLFLLTIATILWLAFISWALAFMNSEAAWALGQMGKHEAAQIFVNSIYVAPCPAIPSVVLNFVWFVTGIAMYRVLPHGKLKAAQHGVDFRQNSETAVPGQAKKMLQRDAADLLAEFIAKMDRAMPSVIRICLPLLIVLTLGAVAWSAFAYWMSGKWLHDANPELFQRVNEVDTSVIFARLHEGIQLLTIPPTLLNILWAVAGIATLSVLVRRKHACEGH